MKYENTIICPECGTEIDVNEVLYDQLEERIRKEYDKKYLKKRKNSMKNLRK